mmetsp:Transcript_12487/g.18677  ORF Transcript_12487/g.18677 Transcript_12487/m.18677 type:complete len:438 (+) Transcript_12487:49-1362(+)
MRETRAFKKATEEYMIIDEISMIAQQREEQMNKTIGTIEKKTRDVVSKLNAESIKEQINKYWNTITMGTTAIIIGTLYIMMTTGGTKESEKERKMRELLEECDEESRKVEEQKHQTKYCGIRNQGATCYLNSILQMMYHIKPFKESLFSIEARDGAPVRELQRLYADMHERQNKDMQATRRAVSTKKLIKSFGWTDEAAFIQHDIQELFQVLRNHLEEQFEDTLAEGGMDIFKGYEQTVLTSKRLKEPIRSSKIPFYELSIAIKNMRTLKEALHDYVRPTTIHDYTINGVKGEAKRGTQLIKLPKVLMIHLLRYEYIGGIKRKIHQPFNYGQTLLMDSQKQTNQRYTLYAVLVHQGSTADSGHYYCYIQAAKDKWFKFNDHRVSEATLEQATVDMYANFNAAPYMLVYVKEDAIENVLKPITHVPDHITQSSTCSIM